MAETERAMGYMKIIVAAAAAVAGSLFTQPSFAISVTSAGSTAQITGFAKQASGVNQVSSYQRKYYPRQADWISNRWHIQPCGGSRNCGGPWMYHHGYLLYNGSGYYPYYNFGDYPRFYPSRHGYYPYYRYGYYPYVYGYYPHYYPGYRS